MPSEDASAGPVRPAADGPGDFAHPRRRVPLARARSRWHHRGRGGTIARGDPNMADEIRLTRPWLVAVWPGMGHVALGAGYYLMAKLGMHQLAEFAAEGLFDVEHVEVKGGLIRPGRLPRSRFFVWNDPLGRHDLVVFIGEAQPPLGKYTFCRRLIEFARGLGVERVFTFAAMATQMHPASARASSARHRRGDARRAEAAGAGDPRRRPHRRAQRRAARRGRRGGPAGGVPAGGDAARLRPVPVPEGVAGRPRRLHDHRGHRSSTPPSCPSRPGTWSSSSATCWRGCSRRTSRPRPTRTRRPAASPPRKGGSPRRTRIASTASSSRPGGTAPSLRAEGRAGPPRGVPGVRGPLPRPVQAGGMSRGVGSGTRASPASIAVLAETPCAANVEWGPGSKTSWCLRPGGLGRSDPP